jgi:hypothetical protein
MHRPLILLRTLATALVGWLCIGCAPQPIAGGFYPASTRSQEVIAAAAFAVEAHAKARSGGGAASTPVLELVKILRADQQVVAGTNFRLKLRVRENGNTRTALALVWWQPWRSDGPYQLSSWTWE